MFGVSFQRIVQFFCLILSLLQIQCRGLQSVENNQKNPECKSKLEISLEVEKILDKFPYNSDSAFIIDDNEWYELELDKVVAKWEKYTKTSFDYWGLKKLLKFAPRGSDILIPELVKNKKAFDVVEDVLSTVQKNQANILAYWNEGHLLHYDVKSLYYTFFSERIPQVSNILNQNKVVLEVSQAISIILPILNIAVAAGMGGAVNNYLTNKIFGQEVTLKESLIEGFKNGIKRPIRSHILTPAVFKSGEEIDWSKYAPMMGKFTLGDHYSAIKAGFKYLCGNFLTPNNLRVSNFFSTMAASVISVAWLAFDDYLLFSSFKDPIGRFVFLSKVANSLHRQLVGIAEINRSLKKIDQLLIICPHLRDCEIVKNIQNITNKNISPKLKEILDLLDSSTFKGHSWVYSRGRLLYTHRVTQELKDELIYVMQQIGLLGGYLAMAKLVKDYQDKKTFFCFVEFIEQETPKIELKNVWIPLIAEDSLVQNNVQLGHENGARHAVITGPNGGGKTICMMSVAFNVVLSRLGIAAAEKVVMTKFAKVKTCLKPVSDISGGLSAFMAEQKNEEEIRKLIKNTKGNILILLDEPYKGTIAEEAALRVCEFGRFLATIPYCVSLIATHLQQPTELTQETNGLFANYQMGYIQKGNGEFIRTFRLGEGAATWWFEDSEKRANFINWLSAYM